jgi:hemoglobin-like flavoprotein
MNPIPASTVKDEKSGDTIVNSETSPVLATLQIPLLRESFGLVESKAGITGLIFYRQLFTLDPSLRSLFHTSIELQGRKLMEALTYTIDALEQPTRLVPVLEALGRRHIAYKVKPEHYPIVIAALLTTLSEVLETAFTGEVRDAWEAALNFVSMVMQRGAGVGQAGGLKEC